MPGTTVDNVVYADDTICIAQIAAAINNYGDLKDYWSTKMFLGNEKFSKVMPRNEFQNIRSSLRFLSFIRP